MQTISIRRDTKAWTMQVWISFFSAVSTRERAQAWLKLQGYEPTTLQLSAFTRLGARATQANIAFDDHPNYKRFSDRIETVTVDPMFAWLQRSGLGAAPIAVR